MMTNFTQKRLIMFILLCSFNTFSTPSFQCQAGHTKTPKNTTCALLNPKTLRSAAKLATIAQYLLPDEILDHEEALPINLSFNKDREEFVISRATKQPQSCKDFLKVTAQILTAQANYMESKEKKSTAQQFTVQTSKTRQRRRSITSSHSEEFDKNIQMQEIHIKQD